jgi:hypothetical protein
MSARFTRRGVSKFFFFATIANIQSVTRAEITSATDLSDHIADVNGWQLTNQAIPTPDLGSTFDKSIPGSDSASDSSLTFYEDMDEDDIETLLPKGTTGFIGIMRKGDKPADASFDVFPVRVASKSPEYSVGNDPARFMANFTITDVPALDTVIPAVGP